MITFELHNYNWHYMHYFEVTFAVTYQLNTALHGLLHMSLHGSLHDQLHHHDWHYIIMNSSESVVVLPSRPGRGGLRLARQVSEPCQPE